MKDWMEKAGREQKGEAILVERGWNERLEDNRAEGRDGGAGELKRWNASNGGVSNEGAEPGCRKQVEELKTRHK